MDILIGELVGRRCNIVVLDNLTQGHRLAVIPRAVFVQDDLGDEEALESIF